MGPETASSPQRRNRISAFLGQWFSSGTTRAPAQAPTKAQAPSAPARTRDTPGAIAALELARAYIEEVREAETPGLEDQELRKHHLNTLALASKQLDAAQRLDPDAILEGQDQKEIPYRFNVNELKAEARLLESSTPSNI
jgi:hypothetical protein